MAEFPVLPFYTDAYLADTTHLSTLEHGAYSLMLWRAWRTPGCCLPNDPEFLRRITKTTARQWERIWPTISEFWEERDGNLYQGRLTDEHDAVRRKSNRQSAKAKARWLKNNNSDDAAASPGQCQSDASLNPSPSPSSTDTSLRSVSGAVAPLNGTPVDDMSRAIWNGGLRWLIENTGKREDQLRPLLGKWIKALGEGEVFEKFRVMFRAPPADPISWMENICNERSGKKPSATATAVSGILGLGVEGRPPRAG